MPGTLLIQHGPFRTQAARDASEMGDDAYASYIEQHTLELAERFPAERDYFISRSLGEALRGNDGA